MPMTRKAALMSISGVAILGNVLLAAVAWGDLRQVCPDGAQCGDAWSSVILLAGLAVAFLVALVLIWGGRIQ